MDRDWQTGTVSDVHTDHSGLVGFQRTIDLGMVCTK